MGTGVAEVDASTCVLGKVLQKIPAPEPAGRGADCFTIHWPAWPMRQDRMLPPGVGDTRPVHT